MALSDYEKQVLAEMEQHLRKADPDLADAMASSLPEEEKPEQPEEVTSLSPRKIALGAILFTVGLGTVLLGVSFEFSIWAVVLGAIGFIAMVAGVLYALSPDTSAPNSAANGSGKTRPGRTKEEREQRRRERWENRGRNR